MLSLSRPDLPSFLTRCAVLLLLPPVAAVVGYSIAHEYWMLAGGVLFVPFFLVWPVEVSLGLFAFFVPFEAVALIAPGTSLSFLVGAVAGIGLLTVGVIDRRLEKPPRAALWWTLFMLLGATTVLWAYNPDKVIDRLPTAFALLLLYLAAVSLKVTEKELFWVAILAIAGAVVASAMSSSGFYGGIGFQDTARSTITEGENASDPNMYAAALLLPLSLAMGLFLSSKNIFFKIAMAACAGMIGFAVLLTMSRGALVAILVMIAVYAIRYRLTWKLLVPIAMLSSGIAFLPDSFFTRLNIAVATGGAGRTSIWRAGLEAAKHYGWFGAGLENFPDVYPFFAGFAMQFRGYHADSHNVFLATWVEMGIPGLALMALAFAAHWRHLRDNVTSRIVKSTSPLIVAAEAAFWALLVCCFFLNMLWRKSFWLVLIVMVLSVKSRVLQEQQAQEQNVPEQDPFLEHEHWYARRYQRAARL